MLIKEDYINQINYVVEKKKEYIKNLSVLFENSFNNIELVGCGATLSQMYVLQYFLDQHIEVPSRIVNSGEVSVRKAKTINEKTLVVVSSHSGSTRETVEAARTAKEQGAVVIAISANANSKLADNADYTLIYPSEGTAPSEAKLVLLLLIGIVLVQKAGLDSGSLISDWAKLPEALWSVREKAKQTAPEFAAKFENKDMFYILGSGPAYGAAYAFSICKFMEMQWLDACALQCGEFFHGPLEKTDSDSNYILLKAEDLTSPLATRVEEFITKHAENYYIINTADYELGDITKENREFFAVLALWPIMNTYMEHFAEKTGHDLGLRRYMGKIDY